MEGVTFLPIQMTHNWWAIHGITVVLGVLVVALWTGFQALLIHYHLFRKSLNKPRTDLIRINMIEKTIALQAEQMDRVFEKLAELRKEQRAQFKEAAAPVRRSEPASVEASFASLGELNLKKRIQELKQDSEVVN